MTTTTTESTAIAKARRRIEVLLERNAERLESNRCRALASIDDAASLKQERVLLLRLLAQHGGDAEAFEMDGAEVTG